MKIISTLLKVSLLGCVLSMGCFTQMAAPQAHGQTLTVPQLVGHVITYQGQNYLISTNAAGGYDVQSFGVQGTNVITVPTTPEQAFQVATAWINENNPAEIGFYNTNEIVAKLGVGYLQNAGQSVAVLGAEKYGLFGLQNFGVGGGILQGNNGGQSGTAGAYAEFDYRKPIGNVAYRGGLVGGYDNWDARPFVGPLAGLEYRQSQHLGEWIDVIYAYEANEPSRGLMIAGGVSASF